MEGEGGRGEWKEDARREKEKVPTAQLHRWPRQGGTDLPFFGTIRMKNCPAFVAFCWAVLCRTGSIGGAERCNVVVQAHALKFADAEPSECDVGQVRSRRSREILHRRCWRLPISLPGPLRLSLGPIGGDGE